MATWLNHHHLQYFRLIAHEGGVSAAARRMGITHSTLSSQLRQLEEVLRAPLFDRKGRRLVLTSFGEQVLSYAEAIHRMGTQLLDFAAGVGAPDHRRPFRVAAVASLPKSIVYRLLQPVLAGRRWGPVEIRERSPSALLGDLVSGRVHLGLTDEPIVQPGVHSHLLGASGFQWFSTAKARAALHGRFPESLAGAAFVLPASSTLRRALDRWLVQHVRRFRVAAEADDSAMLRVLGANAVGVFPVRDALQAEVTDLLRAQPVGPISGVVESYYALSLERTVQDEAVAAVVSAARLALGKRGRGQER
ncbi:MAG: LysR family transcriptional regulator [Myxococcales bacterium]|nr:LysR family transcriptional regulator [Myxococcales bacterium]